MHRPMTSRLFAGRRPRAASTAAVAATALLAISGCGVSNNGNGDSATKNGVISEPSPFTTVGEDPLVTVLPTPVGDEPGGEEGQGAEDADEGGAPRE